MEKFKTNCYKCGGFGHLDISHQPEPWMAFYVRCNHCDGHGWIFNEDKIKDRIYELDCMIDGMIQRIKNFQFMVVQCHRGLLFEMADKFDSRVEVCSVALGRLKKYRNKLNKMI
jgi:hypothetical protein